MQPKLIQYVYFTPGDELPKPQPVVINVGEKSLKIIPDDMFKNAIKESGELDIRWSTRSDEFYFHYNQRGHQLFRILAANADTGIVRTVVEEQSKTSLEWTSIIMISIKWTLLKVVVITALVDVVDVGDIDRTTGYRASERSQI